MQELQGESRRKRSDRVAVNFSIPLDAKAILVRVVGPKARVHGEFIARLLYEFEARQEGRREALAEAAAAGGAH